MIVRFSTFYNDLLKGFSILQFLLLCTGVNGNIVTQHLYINRGLFTTVDQEIFPFLAYNESTTFSPLNAVIKIDVDDTLLIIIHNNDTAVHSFKIKGDTTNLNDLNYGESDTFLFDPPGNGIYIYYDSQFYPANRYMGLGGMICVFTNSFQAYYWNLKEHEREFNIKLGVGLPVDFNEYEPDYFTINGLSFPDLQTDTLSKIEASVNDTIQIFIANTGQSLHSIHFHGFHCKVLFSTSSRVKVNSVKDTFPIGSMEGVLLGLIPDKPGLYSVHDHNLVAVTGGNTHPNGMFTIMEIQ